MSAEKNSTDVKRVITLEQRTEKAVLIVLSAGRLASLKARKTLPSEVLLSQSHKMMKGVLL